MTEPIAAVIEGPTSRLGWQWKALLSIVLTGVVAALFEWRLGDGSWKTWLYSIGGALEIVGIGFVAWPELGPLAAHARGRLHLAYQRTARAADRLL